MRRMCGILVLAIAGVAAAEPDVPFMDLTATHSGGKLQVIDNQRSGTLLMDIPTASIVKLYDVSGTQLFGLHTVTFDLTRSDGFDMTVTITTGATAVNRGVVEMGCIWLEPEITRRNIEAYGQAVTMLTTNHAGGAPRVLGPLRMYPGAYSPVEAVSNNLLDDVVNPPGGGYTPPAHQYALGINVIYPLTTYKHIGRYRIEQGAGGCAGGGLSHPGNPNWTLYADFNDSPQSAEENPAGMVPANSTRSYTFAFRMARTDRDAPANWWLRTLEPYRQSFHSSYGGVQYTRDADPVDPMVMAGLSACSVGNPNGFDTRWNLQTSGFTPAMTEMDRREYELGYSRHMMWFPTGVYCTGNPNYNIPFLFTSRWASYGQAGATFAALQAWAQNHKLGMYWGHAATRQDQWPPTTEWVLNPTVGSADRTAALAELDGALDAEVYEVGLDAFPYWMMPWNGGPWLEDMISHSATQTGRDVKFIVEAAACDYMHRLGASYVNSWAPGWLGSDAPHPHLLANFLLPGNEIWYALNEAPDTEAVRQGKLAYLASLGFNFVELTQADVPVNTVPGGGQSFGSPLHPLYLASETWQYQTPIHVLRCSPADIAFDNGDTLLNADWSAATLNKVNSGVTSADYLTFLVEHGNGTSNADIAYDNGTPLPPFGYSTGANSGVTSADMFCFFTYFSGGCP
jgi:hypothetical protein